MQFSFGLIPNVRAKGKSSVRVADILGRMQVEEPVNTSDVILIESYNNIRAIVCVFYIKFNDLSFALLQMVVPEINTLILIDREVSLYLLLSVSWTGLTLMIIIDMCTSWMQVDMVTPMCTQLTYEGLLDEVTNKQQKLYFYPLLSSEISTCNYRLIDKLEIDQEKLM